MTNRRLTILCDIDETVADLLGPWLRRYNKAYNDTLLPELLTEWDLQKAVKPECGDEIYRFLDASLYDEILPIPGARSGIQLLRLMGHRVVFVSSCTPDTIDAKLRWLKRYGFLNPASRFEPDFIAASEKSLVRGDVILDDKLETVEEFPGMAWLVSQPQNGFVKTHRPRLAAVAHAPAAIQRWLDESPYADAV